jgi:glycogen operon protein
VFNSRGRRPWASLNFVTAHDGFTLEDLVTYEAKRNLANLEDNRDGTDDNLGWNCGVEGPTKDPHILALRARQKRNFLATLVLSQGTPMLLAGDELGRTQGGNNNAYCQDNETSWMDWESRSPEDLALSAFVQQLLRIRAENPVFRSPVFFSETTATWHSLGGRPMEDADWRLAHARCVGLHLRSASAGPAARSALLLFNGSSDEVPFILPSGDFGVRWVVCADTAQPAAMAEGHQVDAGMTVPLAPHSFVLLLEADDVG